MNQEFLYGNLKHRVNWELLKFFNDHWQKYFNFTLLFSELIDFFFPSFESNSPKAFVSISWGFEAFSFLPTFSAQTCEKFLHKINQEEKFHQAPTRKYLLMNEFDFEKGSVVDTEIYAQISPEIRNFFNFSIHMRNHFTSWNPSTLKS